MAAPKENLFALGNNGGRPKIYESAKELERECAKYFEYLVENKKNPTITGLALFLGFNSRGMLYQYRDKAGYEEFSLIIKRAMLCVESGYEDALHTFKYGGAVFALKNMGWADKQEIDNKVSIMKADLKLIGGEIELPSSESDVKLD